MHCDPVCLVQTPFRASGPKWGKNRKNIGFGLPPENRKKIAEKWPQTQFLPIFGPIFQFFGYFFPIFRGEAETYIFPIFPHFGLEARNGVCTRQTGSQSMQTSRDILPKSLVSLGFEGRGKPLRLLLPGRTRTS